MADQDEEELQMALKMSMQPSSSPPEPKRSKPRDPAIGTTIDGASASDESPELKSRRLQRELMAAAAEKRMMISTPSPPTTGAGAESGNEVKRRENLGEELSVEEANQLFNMVFGGNVTKEILAQWTNQGIRYYLYLLCCDFIGFEYF